MTDKNVKTAADDQPGACYIPDPQTGQPRCHYITKSECDQRGGTFYGGLCPPIDSVASAKLKPGEAKAKTKPGKKAKNVQKTKSPKKRTTTTKKAVAKRKRKAE